MSAARGERGRSGRDQSGYAYIMALFLVVATIISSQVVMRNWVTEGRRERETEMIWRGNQYARAIRMYYRKTGHYPASLEELQKGLPDLHFLRATAYKDPMNKADGSWRLIYVNAAGQIIGSVKYASLQQMALMDLNGGKLPASTSGTGTSSAPDQASSPDSSSQASGQPQTGQVGAASSSSSPGLAGEGQVGKMSPFSGSGLAGGTGRPGASPFSGVALTSNANAITQAKPTGPVDGPVLGAFLTGVAGGHHYDGPSVKVYKSGTTYQQWEFIWNPLEEQARAIASGLAPPGQPSGTLGLPIANPNGSGTSIGPGPGQGVNPPPGGGPGIQPPSPQLPPDQPLVQ